MATALKTCDDCGRAIDTIRRASDDTSVEVLAEPRRGEGDWMRLSALGRPQHGKYVKLTGQALHAARAEGVLLYTAHTREVCRRG